MKKYLFGIFALLLAVTFSSFTAEPSSKKNTTVLYWYPVAGEFTSDDDPLKHSTEEDARDLDCPDSIDQPVCLFGSENGALPANTPVPMNDEDVIIRYED
jgi:hypothetical protein